MAAGQLVSTFLERSRSARKIIVVDFGFLGDSVHLVPALWEIKRHYPHAELHTLSAPVGAELLRLAPCVDHARAFPLTSKSPAWWKHWGILRQLRHEHFDLAFNFTGSDRTIFVTAALGVRMALAHEAARRHFWNHWLSVEWVEQVNRQWPVYEQRRRVLATAGFSLEAPRFDLQVPQDAQQWAETAVAARPIHFSISTSRPDTEWPLENWIGLAQMLAQRNPSIRIVASAGSNPREQDRLRQLAGAALGGRVQAFEGLSIPRLAALLPRCRLQVGADSGVLHLAMALGVPTLTVFRQSSALAQWTPVGNQHRQIVADCRCINENRSDCRLAGRSACLGSITSSQVFAEICQILK